MGERAREGGGEGGRERGWVGGRDTHLDRRLRNWSNLANASAAASSMAASMREGGFEREGGGGRERAAHHLRLQQGEGTQGVWREGGRGVGGTTNLTRRQAFKHARTQIHTDPLFLTVFHLSFSVARLSLSLSLSLFLSLVFLSRSSLPLFPYRVLPLLS